MMTTLFASKCQKILLKSRRKVRMYCIMNVCLCVFMCSFGVKSNYRLKCTILGLCQNLIFAFFYWFGLIVKKRNCVLSVDEKTTKIEKT